MACRKAPEWRSDKSGSAISARPASTPYLSRAVVLNSAGKGALIVILRIRLKLMGFLPLLLTAQSSQRIKPDGTHRWRKAGGECDDGKQHDDSRHDRRIASCHRKQPARKKHGHNQHHWQR